VLSGEASRSLKEEQFFTRACRQLWHGRSDGRRGEIDDTP
jgi:hypothetical protein